MVLRIRLARFGKTNDPFYNIVVAHARTARNSKPLEVLGTYNPVAIRPIDPTQKPYKDIKLDISRAKYWIGVGAQPSDTAWRLLSMVGILPPQFRKQKWREQAAEADARLQRDQTSKDINSMSDKELAAKFTGDNAPS
ncbi:ribosomal protein S16, mitochondrial [Verruconis gallopava]|uniref:Ribosomal protein S16, mitochondrial n=1 Tax=Verruconis gallopava TaxID=253628 RepID=A0A0D2AE07_9PEZI|nr:ribosomal protein S16, mitochondrial [Verruconis gallopava]KIW04700.1 ribosomal protein S16, mitochondrial [Verruconis gallopava]